VGFVTNTEINELQGNANEQQMSSMQLLQPGDTQGTNKCLYSSCFCTAGFIPSFSDSARYMLCHLPWGVHIAVVVFIAAVGFLTRYCEWV
jgi:hypothetical protein